MGSFKVTKRFFFGGDPTNRQYNEGEVLTDLTDDQIKRALAVESIEEVKADGDAGTGADDLDTKTKQDLIDYAKKNSIEINERDKKEVVLEAIKAAQA